MKGGYKMTYSIQLVYAAIAGDTSMSTLPKTIMYKLLKLPN